MANLASGRESSRLVIRVCGAVVVLLVTGITVRGNVYVVIVHVALDAGHGRVRPSKGETRLTVIEGCGDPRRRVVADLALLWKPCLRMIGVVGLVVVRQVTGDTRGVRQFVISIEVTLRALHRCMSAGQRKASTIMVELRSRPRNCGVTDRTIGRESSLPMIGVSGAVVILHVASTASDTAQVVVAVDVTLRALQRCVPSGQRKSHQAMVESCRLPGIGSVASLAGLWQVQSHVVRVRRPAEIRQVASDAIRGRAFEFSSDVASRAVEGDVHPRQRKPCVFQVIKLHSKPIVHAVALLARGGKTRGNVAGAGRVLIVDSVAGIALRS